MCACYVCHTVVQFQVSIQNRYKLNKKYRKFSPLPSNPEDCDTSLETKTLAVQAKVWWLSFVTCIGYFQVLTCTCTCTCVVMDFSRLSLYCPYLMVFQCASKRFLKELTEVTLTTCWGRLFQELITLWLKKFFLRSRRDLLRDSLRLCPRRPCELPERWKSWCESMFSFPVKIL